MSAPLDPGVAEIKTAIERLDAPLDEVTRARIEAKLLASLDRAPAATRPTWIRHARWAAPLAAAAAAVIVIATRPPIEEPHAIIAPSTIAGFESSQAIGASLERVEAPSGGVLRAAVGADAYVALIGPGSFSVRARTKDRVVLALESGVLVADVKPDRARAFVVESPSATVEVVGTLFAVDARPAVAVARGVVEVHPQGITLTAGQRWPAGGENNLDAEMNEHAISPRATSIDAGVLVVKSALAGAHAKLENGAPLGPLPLRVALDPGRYTLIVTREGRAPQTIEAELTKRGTASVDVSWPEPVREEPLEPEEPEKPAQDPARERAPQKPLDAETLYRRAEQSLLRNDRAKGAAQLRELVQRFPNDPLADSALYDLARIAGDREQARAYLEELLARPSDPAVAEPAQHMLCKLHVEVGREREAIECLAAFHRRYPSSAHNRAVLRSLAALAERAAGCRAALPWIEELARSHPDDPLAAELEERRKRCGN